MSKKAIYLAAVLVIILLRPGFSQTVLRNPGFPAKETAVYTRTKENETFTVKTILQYVDNGDSSWWEYRSYSPNQDILVKFDPETLNAFYSEVWDKTDKSLVHNTSEILKNRIKLTGNELLITDANGFLTNLRGFPWGKQDSAKIIFIRSRGKVGMDLKVKGKETLNLQNKNYECWKVQIGMSGITGALFPKSYFWFTVVPPHFLVKSEESGMPGMAKTVTEIVSYREE